MVARDGIAQHYTALSIPLTPVANKTLELLGKELGRFQPKPESPMGDVQEMIATLNDGRRRVAEEQAKPEEAARVLDGVAEFVGHNEPNVWSHDGQ
ncbi:MAG: hypothetical protein ACLQU1_20670 [Bryobacteraceae bacterium]